MSKLTLRNVHSRIVESGWCKSQSVRGNECVRLLGDMPIEKLKADAADPAIIAQINKEINQLKNSGIPRLSVPKFLVAGKEPQGRDLATFSAMIDAELKKKGK